MPITFSLRSVAWLGVDPADFKNPSGTPAPRHSAPLVYDIGKPADEIQYLVHGCPQVTRVSAVKGETDARAVYGLAGEVLYIGGGYPAYITNDQYSAVSDVYTAFAAERAAGRLR